MDYLGGLGCFWWSSKAGFGGGDRLGAASFLPTREGGGTPVWLSGAASAGDLKDAIVYLGALKASFVYLG
ncbi:hypothetical protein D5S17_34275 [Pseudonocardiaceae bacterium YIM PH 21723]|nr:hypothetical protein D5S17_34275 [Pseudonocardiaceae bacterium YIM PH 21723]